MNSLLVRNNRAAEIISPDKSSSLPNFVCNKPSKSIYIELFMEKSKIKRDNIDEQWIRELQMFKR
jgi:hypothetical protein